MSPPRMTHAQTAAVGTKAKATVNKEAFESRRERARVRAASYDRPLVAVLALGVTAEMLASIMDPDSDLRPKSAKEAIEVARVALALARQELGEGDVKPEDLDDDRRAVLKARADSLLAQIRAEPGSLALHAGRPVAVPDAPADAS